MVCILERCIWVNIVMVRRSEFDIDMFLKCFEKYDKLVIVFKFN